MTTNPKTRIKALTFVAAVWASLAGPCGLDLVRCSFNPFGQSELSFHNALRITRKIANSAVLFPSAQGYNLFTYNHPFLLKNTSCTTAITSITAITPTYP